MKTLIIAVMGLAVALTLTLTPQPAEDVAEALLLGELNNDRAEGAPQQSVVAATNKRAAAASAAATPKLLALLETPDVRTALRQCCSAVADLTATELLERLRAELRAAELAHNFPTVDEDMHAGSDMTLDQIDEFAWWLNPYEVELVDKEIQVRQGFSLV